MNAVPVRSGAEFLALLRSRAVELNTTRLAIDDVAGFASGYAGKLLGPRQVRRVIHESAWPLLGALGLKMIVAEDPEAVERVCGRYRRQTEKHLTSVKGKGNAKCPITTSA